MAEPLTEYRDEPLMVAHLLGGANGVSIDPVTDTEIARRVEIAIRYAREIRRQLAIPEKRV